MPYTCGSRRALGALLLIETVVRVAAGWSTRAVATPTPRPRPQGATSRFGFEMKNAMPALWPAGTSASSATLPYGTRMVSPAL